MHRFGTLVNFRASATLAVTLTSTESGLISQSFYAFGSDGICNLDAKGFIVLWPGRNSPHGRTFDSNVTLTITFADISGSGIVFSPFVAILQRLECPEGTEYDIYSYSCTSCFPSQYGVIFFSLKIYNKLLILFS